jgi:hypothetical protein
MVHTAVIQQQETGHGANQAFSINAQPISLLGVKRLVCGIGHSPTFSTEVKERVDL